MKWGEMKRGALLLYTWRDEKGGPDRLSVGMLLTDFVDGKGVQLLQISERKTEILRGFAQACRATHDVSEQGKWHFPRSRANSGPPKPASTP